MHARLASIGQRADNSAVNYRHAFHAGNHADVLKHVVLLALCDALTGKPAPCFALDTHAGRGLYALDGEAARRTGESREGIDRLPAASIGDVKILRYLNAVAACRLRYGEHAYPGSPWLLAHALRPFDHIACCELQPEEATALKASLCGDPRVAVHQRDAYSALKALLPPIAGGQRFARGLVLLDPSYEAQLDEFDLALAALRDGLSRWPQAIYALWYPIKQRRTLARFYRNAADLACRSTMLIELLVHADDSPLRMNGSGLLLLNAPWRFETSFAPTLSGLASMLAPTMQSSRIELLKSPS